jgi:hypothetical protein
MPILHKDQVETKALNDQIRLAVTQAILKVIGPEYTIRILTGTVEVADLMPTGQNVSLKMSIDVYPKD